MRKFAFTIALLASVAQPALAYAGTAAAAPPVEAPSAGDKVRDAIRGGLISLATVFTNAGAAIITNRVIQAGTAAKNIGWGVGTNAAAVTDTTLQTESAPTTSGGRTVGTESRTTVTNTNDNYQVFGTVTAAGPLSITEAGLFDAVTAGNMLIRSVFGVVTVAANDAIAFTFGLRMVPG